MPSPDNPRPEVARPRLREAAAGDVRRADHTDDPSRADHLSCPPPPRRSRLPPGSQRSSRFRAKTPPRLVLAAHRSAARSARLPTSLATPLAFGGRVVGNCQHQRSVLKGGRARALGVWVGALGKNASFWCVLPDDVICPLVGDHGFDVCDLMAGDDSELV